MSAPSWPAWYASGLAEKADGEFELCDRCESARASSEASCTAGRAPEELEESRPIERSEYEEPMTSKAGAVGSERSEKEMPSEAALRSLSGDRPPRGTGDPPGVSLPPAGRTPAELPLAPGGGEPRPCCNAAKVPGCSCKILRRAGSELEWPTRICPERRDEDCDRLPSERCDEV